MPLLIDFIRIRRPTFFYTTPHAGSKSPLFTSGEASMGEYKPWTKHGRNMDDPWINVSITGCAYRAELILGR